MFKLKYVLCFFCQVGEIKRGDVVLVTSAAGGTGQFAVTPPVQSQFTKIHEKTLYSWFNILLKVYLAALKQHPVYMHAVILVESCVRN